LTGVHIRRARYIKEYNDDEELCLPITGRKPGAGSKAKLTDNHSQFPIGYVNEHRHKGIAITTLGIISQAGVIDISLKKPQAVAISRRGRKMMQRPWW
jgi:hypothetical protein